MKFKQMNLAKSFAAVMMMFLGLTFASCDDNNEPTDGNLTKKTMYGEYKGFMTSQTSATSDSEAEGVEITANVNDDIVCFNSFPIHNIVMSIVGDEEAANAIVEAVGEIKYEIGYTPTVITSSKSISMELHPEPLVLSVALSPEAEPLTVTVEISALSDASFNSLNSKMNFAITIDKVWLGDDDNKTELSGFEQLTLSFDLTQEKE